MIADKLRDGAVGDLLNFECVRQSSGYQVGLRDGRQTYQLNTRGEAVRNRSPHGNRQPRFTGAARTCETQQPDVFSQ